MTFAGAAAASLFTVGSLLLTKFSLSLSAYLLASWRSFSARVSELALSMSNSDRLLVLNELGVRIVAVTDVEEAGVLVTEDRDSGLGAGFANSPESVFLLRLLLLLLGLLLFVVLALGILKVAVTEDVALSLLFSLAVVVVVAEDLGAVIVYETLILLPSSSGMP